VALGLSVRTVNRHISAQKLKSRLMDGRREVFVPRSDESGTRPLTKQSDTSVATIQDMERDTATASPSVSPEISNPSTHASAEKEVDPSTPLPDSFLDLDTALAMADRKADRQVELAVRAYQSLTQTIEGQARDARRMARIAWCIVGVLAIGSASALVWTARQVTEAESDSQHLKMQADELDKRAADSEKRLADTQEKLSVAEQHASRAEGRMSAFEEMQLRQPATQPSTRPTTQSLIDRLTTAFGPSGQ
jgi:hypothetical protein